MGTSRRSFLRLAAAAPLLKPKPGRVGEGSLPNSEFDPRIEVLPQNLRHNAAEVRRHISGRPILAVIKNNGYGLGLANVAQVLESAEGIEGFAVVKLQEAHTLRDAGIQKPLLLMGTAGGKDLEDAVRRGIRPMVYTFIGETLEATARKLRMEIPIHICVDTGIGRVGIPYREAAVLVRDLARRKGIRLEGIMMTFTEDAEFDREQLRRFRDLCGSLESDGIVMGRKHAASSYSLFQHPQSYLDMVRPGMVLFGVYPDPSFRKSGILELRPAVRFQARVVYVKRLKPGDSAGYNRSYLAKKDVWVATLPVGHADGLPRIAANGGRVRIRGEMYPLIASVSASHSIAEIGSEPNVQAGDIVTFFDDQEGSRPEDLGAASGASVYDLMMHLSALLPRTVAAEDP